MSCSSQSGAHDEVGDGAGCFRYGPMQRNWQLCEQQDLCCRCGRYAMQECAMPSVSLLTLARNILAWRAFWTLHSFQVSFLLPCTLIVTVIIIIIIVIVVIIAFSNDYVSCRLLTFKYLMVNLIKKMKIMSMLFTNRRWHTRHCTAILATAELSFHQVIINFRTTRQLLDVCHPVLKQT